MADTAKILGQTANASSEVDLYTVPGATSTVISSIVVCNRSVTATTFRIYVAIAGAAATNAQYLYYDVSLPGLDTFIATIGATLATTDVLRVLSGNANVSFNAFGIEST